MDALYLAVSAAGLVASIPVARLMTTYLRKLVEFVIDWFFPKYFCDENNAQMILEFLQRNSKSFGVTSAQYQGERVWVRPIQKVITVWFVAITTRQRMYWFCRRPLRYVPAGSERVGGTTMATNSYFQFLRGSINWPKLLELVGAKYDHEFEEMADKVSLFRIVRHTGRIKGQAVANDDNDPGAPDDFSNSATKGSPTYLRAPIGWKPEELGLVDEETSKLDLLSLTPSMKKVIRDVEFFYGHRQWYEDREIPWRRGYLLYGKPGTGKTSLVRALAEKLGLPVHIFNLATMDDHDFLRAWGQTRHEFRKIVLLEDFDTIFHGRENIHAYSKLSFETVLNCIDGIERNNGLILFVTTNEVVEIDEALGRPDENDNSTRPGRIDVIAHMDNLDYDGRFKIAMRILRDKEAAESLSRRAPPETTPVQFESMCIVAAQATLWATYKPGPLGSL